MLKNIDKIIVEENAGIQRIIRPEHNWRILHEEDIGHRKG